MSAAMEIILLERVDNLGQMGDVVKVRNGYARNYLLPQKKALRATKDNIAYFEGQRATLEKLNAEKRAEAQKLAKKVEGLKVTIIRHASEAGQLYGSVTARDVAQAINEQGKQELGRSQVHLDQGFKSIGIFPVTVALHPEVKISVTVNIARTEEEAKIQAKTGKAVIAEALAAPEAADEAAAKAGMLEESALEAEKEWSEEEARAEAEKAEKAARRAAKKAARAEDSEEEDTDSEEE